MTLDDLLHTIVESSTQDWNVIGCWGAGAGPSYKDAFIFYEQWKGQTGIVHAESHAYIAAFRANLSITMAWGLRHNEDFRETWANKFSDPHAASSYLDIFYCNALVFRAIYVAVDGGRAYLPLPTLRPQQPDVVVLEITRGEYRLAKLIDSLSHAGSDFERYLQQAEIHVVADKEWPA